MGDFNNFQKEITKTITEQWKHPVYSRIGATKGKYATEYIATGFTTELRIEIKGKISDHYLIQVEMPEIEKQQYYVFGNYKRKKINEIINKQRNKYIKQLEEKTIGGIFPMEAIKSHKKPDKEKNNTWEI